MPGVLLNFSISWYFDIPICGGSCGPEAIASERPGFQTDLWFNREQPTTVCLESLVHSEQLGQLRIFRFGKTSTSSLLDTVLNSIDMEKMLED